MTRSGVHAFGPWFEGRRQVIRAAWERILEFEEISLATDQREAAFATLWAALPRGLGDLPLLDEPIIGGGG